MMSIKEKCQLQVCVTKWQGQDFEQVSVQEPLRVFGPPGVYYLLKSSIGYTDSHAVMPIIVGEWTIDPEGSLPPTEDPAVPGLFSARIAPDADCVGQSNQALSSLFSDDESDEEEDSVSGLDLNVSPVLFGRFRL